MVLHVLGRVGSPKRGATDRGGRHCHELLSLRFTDSQTDYDGLHPSHDTHLTISLTLAVMPRILAAGLLTLQLVDTLRPDRSDQRYLASISCSEAPCSMCKTARGVTWQLNIMKFT